MHFLCSKCSIFLTTYPPLNANVICEGSLSKIEIFLQVLKTVDPVNYQPDKFEPLYVLYYSENSFRNPHYQSIRPNSNLNASVEASQVVQDSHDNLLPEPEPFDKLSSEILDFDDITPPMCESTAIEKNSSDDVWAVLESQVAYFLSAEISEDVFSFGRILDEKKSPFLAHGDCPVSVYKVLSRKHFTLTRVGNSVYLEDQSAAGTYVKNRVVGQGNTIKLNHDDVITIGNEQDIVKKLIKKKITLGFKFKLKSIKPQKRVPSFDQTTVLDSPSEVSSITLLNRKKPKLSNDSNTGNISRILRSSVRRTSSKLSKSGIRYENIIKERRRRRK